MIFLSVSNPQGRVWLRGALELSRIAGHESRVTHSERVPSPGRSMPGGQTSSPTYTVNSWWPADLFFKNYLGYFRYLYIVVIGGPVIVFVVLCARPILGVWRVCGEEDGVGRVARAADYRVSPEPGKWKYNNKIICISTYVLVKLTRFWLWDSLKCVCWKIFILNYI